MIDPPRPHLQGDPPPLHDLPLDAGGVAEVRVFRTRTTGRVAHHATLETWSPVLTQGTAPERPGPVLAFPPECERAATSPPTKRVHFEWDGTTLRAQVPFAAGTSAYGLGEQVGPLSRIGRTHLLWNTDAWRYGPETPALYQSHPWVLAVHPDGSALGILADTPRRGTIAVARDGVELCFEREPFEVHLIDGESPAEVLAALGALVGTAPRPPRWALGFHQCRWSYMDEGEVRRVAARLRAERIPCDALWFDIDYMDRHRVLTWDRERFPDPQALLDDLDAEDFHAVGIVDPGVAAAPGYDLWESGRDGRHFVEDEAGRPVAGRVWPGVCHFPDFTRGSTRAWWADKVRRFVEECGFAGLWCDMNEPALFRTPARTLPDAARHRGLGGGDHARYHNLYGQLMAEATRAGLRAARPGRRPFVLTRAGHLATARFAATWTGDNQSRWEDLRWAPAMVLNLGLSGQPMSGPDLGGFHGAPDAELFVRWFELGAWLPFCRSHADKDSPRQEPWGFGREALTHVRAALEGRMRLLPTWSTLFEEAERTGLPPVRPLFLADPTDRELRDIDDEFLVGTDLLVAPVLTRGSQRRSVRLPRNAGGWFPFHVDGARIERDRIDVPAPLGTCPAYARAGSIVFQGDAVRHTREVDELRVWNVFLDGEGRARGRVFEDDGDSLDGPVLAREIAVHLTAGRLACEVADTGAGKAPERARRLRLHGAPGGVRELPLPLASSFEVDL